MTFPVFLCSLCYLEFFLNLLLFPIFDKIWFQCSWDNQMFLEHVLGFSKLPMLPSVCNSASTYLILGEETLKLSKITPSTYYVRCFILSTCGNKNSPKMLSDLQFIRFQCFKLNCNNCHIFRKKLWAVIAPRWAGAASR